jgi:hypothetical protein
MLQRKDNLFYGFVFSRSLRCISENPMCLANAETAIAIRLVLVGSVLAASIHLLK